MEKMYSSLKAETERIDRILILPANHYDIDLKIIQGIFINTYTHTHTCRIL